MSITCQLCQTKFQKIIPWQHLKTHGVSSKEYTEKYGNLYSSETLAKFAARVPHNKGKKVTDPKKLEKIKATIAARESKYASGQLVRGGYQLSQTTKEKISQAIKAYAQENPEELTRRGKKSHRTKLEKYGVVSSGMKGRHHTDKTKALIRDKLQHHAESKRDQANDRIIKAMAQAKIKVTSDINSWHLDLACLVCQTEFQYTKQYFHPSKFKTNLCPTCYPRNINKSTGELELYEFVKNLCSDAISGYRDHYHGFEIDVYVPSLNIGFEYNGKFWHSEEQLIQCGKSPQADRSKQLYFQKRGIFVVNIFDDEWSEQRTLTMSRIKNILGVTDQKFYARKCNIVELTAAKSSTFLSNNHQLGSDRSSVRLGLVTNDQLVSIMTFNTRNLSRKGVGWELSRFCNLQGTTVVGGASKLFTYFINKNHPAQVTTYSDNRWGTGDLYKILGFTKVSDGAPGYWYFMPNYAKRIHRYTLRKNKSDDQTLTEYQNRLNQGYLRVWDCGSSKWVWTQK